WRGNDANSTEHGTSTAAWRTVGDHDSSSAARRTCHDRCHTDPTDGCSGAEHRGWRGNDANSTEHGTSTAAWRAAADHDSSSAAWCNGRTWNARSDQRAARHRAEADYSEDTGRQHHWPRKSGRGQGLGNREGAGRLNRRCRQWNREH
ncbi:MAG TPA: hypothetical protein VEU31_04635, partial [Candidatus Acidoferrales bacterium]|nr:hypothetical protein [Candidatus Acidoferrales bacterium]